MLASPTHIPRENCIQITKEDPVYSYQNRSFDDIFSRRPISPSEMSSIQSDIRKSLMFVNKKRNTSLGESSLSLENVSTSDLLSKKLKDLEKRESLFSAVNSVFKDLVRNDLKQAGAPSSVKYKHEIILKGIEEQNLLNVVYLLLGFNEQVQYDFISQVSREVRDLFEKDQSGCLRIELINQKLFTIDFVKLSRISNASPFIIKSDNDYSSCFDGVSRYSLGIDEIHQGLSVQGFGSDQKYVSAKKLIDELISYLFHRDYDSFDEKVRLLNQFEFKPQPADHGFSIPEQPLLMAR